MPQTNSNGEDALVARLRGLVRECVRKEYIDDVEDEILGAFSAPHTRPSDQRLRDLIERFDLLASYGPQRLYPGEFED